MRKKTTWKRVVALLLSSMMALSMVGCQSKESGKSENAANNEERELITLSIGVPNYLHPDYAAGGVFTERNAVLQYIKDKFAIELDIIPWDHEKYTLLASSNELPDIAIHYWAANVIYDAIPAGHFIDLTDMLEEHAPNITRELMGMVEVCNMGYDGIYYLPYGAATGASYDILALNAGYGLKVRYDVYKAIGSPEPANEAEYLQMLKDMQDYQRQQTGQDDIYAISFDTNAYLGIGYGDGRGYEYVHPMVIDEETGIAYPGCGDAFVEGQPNPIGEEFRFYARAYRMGLVDPDTFTQTRDQVREKVASGKCLTSARDVNDTVLNRELCGENAVMTYIPNDYFNNVDFLGSPMNPYGGIGCHERGITTNCEYPERALELLDWLTGPEGVRCIYNGIKGVHWDYNEEGVPEYIGELAETYAATGDWVEASKDCTLINSLCGNVWHSSNDVDFGDGYPANFHNISEQIAKNASDAERAFAKDYYEDCEYPGQVYKRWVDEGIMEMSDSSDPLYKRMPVSACDMTLWNEEVDAFWGLLTGEYFVPLMTSETDDEFYALWQEAYEKSGDGEAIKEYTAYYNEWLSEAIENGSK